MQTVDFEGVGNVIPSRLVSNSTLVDSGVVYRCHGDLQVASTLCDPDVLVVVEREA